jgi:hypothetical protein
VVGRRAATTAAPATDGRADAGGAAARRAAAGADQAAAGDDDDRDPRDAERGLRAEVGHGDEGTDGVGEKPAWLGRRSARHSLDGPNSRVIIGTWQTRADWEAWHEDPKFKQTREELKGLETRSSEEWWHEVVANLRAA